MNHSIQFESGLIKVSGIFNYRNKKDHLRFIQHGYDTLPLIELAANTGDEEKQSRIKGTKEFYKNVYYREFHGFLLSGDPGVDYTGNERESVKTLAKKINQTISFLKYNFQLKQEVEHSVTIQSCELYFFPNQIGIFSITIEPDNWSAPAVSDLLLLSRNFNTPIKSVEKKLFHEWISEQLLCGIQLVGDNIQSDAFSGSKFKTYAILNLNESLLDESYQRDHLLYELGTCSLLDSISKNGHDAPSASYYETIMSDKIAVFNNYTGLALLDSFTVIGQGHFTPLQQNAFTYHNWSRVYFSIYLFNLYMRFNLFKFNAEYAIHPVRYRDQFQEFLNRYNFRHISFNFLPNILFSAMRKALMIDVEIEHFQERLQGLAAQLQEEQEKRQALLLTIISVLSAIDTLDGIMEKVNDFKAFLGINSIVFYFLFAIIALFAVAGLSYFLFPHHFNKLIKKINRWFRK